MNDKKGSNKCHNATEYVRGFLCTVGQCKDIFFADSIITGWHVKTVTE